MRYDAETHRARAALLAEGAAKAQSPRQRINLLAHAVIATGLATLAVERKCGTVCHFIDPEITTTRRDQNDRTFGPPHH